MERGHYTFADFAEMIDTFFIEPNLTESSFLKNHFPEFCSVGMFHIKGYDSVSCSYCGRRLYKWQEDDNPYKEHDRHFEECASGHAALFYVLRDFIFKSENVTEATISADCIKNLLLQSAQDQKTIKIIQLISDLDNLYLLSNCETAAVRQANETLRQNLFEVMRSYLCLLKIELNDKTFEFDKYLEKIDSMPERAATKMGTEDLQELEEIIKKIMHKVERTKNHLADTNKKILGMQTEAYPCFVNESEFYGGYNLAKEKYYALHEVFENYRQAFKERYQGVRNFDMTTEMLRNKYLTELLRFYIISEILPKIDVISESTKEAVETANLAPKKDKLYSLCLDKDFCVLRTLFGYTSESCKLFPRLTDRIRAAVSG